METEKKPNLEKFNWYALSWKDAFSLTWRTSLYFLLFFSILFIPLSPLAGIYAESIEPAPFPSPYLFLPIPLFIFAQTLLLACVFKFRFLKFKISNKKVYIIKESGEKINCSWLLGLKLGWAFYWKITTLTLLTGVIVVPYKIYSLPGGEIIPLIQCLLYFFISMIVFKWTFSRKFDGLQIRLAQEDK